MNKQELQWQEEDKLYKSPYLKRTGGEIELLFITRIMSRDEYDFWYRLSRSRIAYLFPETYYLDNQLFRLMKFSNHLIRAQHIDNYQWTGCADKFLYRPVSDAYDNYLSNLLCDYAGDQVDPDAEFMQAYEKHLSDLHQEMYGE